MKDHLVVFDAPYGELQSRWVIDEAKKKYPGKPIRYLVLTQPILQHVSRGRLRYCRCWHFKCGRHARDDIATLTMAERR